MATDMIFFSRAYQSSSLPNLHLLRVLTRSQYFLRLQLLLDRQIRVRVTSVYSMQSGMVLYLQIMKQLLRKLEWCSDSIFYRQVSLIKKSCMKCSECFQNTIEPRFLDDIKDSSSKILMTSYSLMILSRSLFLELSPVSLRNPCSNSACTTCGTSSKLTRYFNSPITALRLCVKQFLTLLPKSASCSICKQIRDSSIYANYSGVLFWTARCGTGCYDHGSEGSVASRYSRVFRYSRYCEEASDSVGMCCRNLLLIRDSFMANQCQGQLVVNFTLCLRAWILNITLASLIPMSNILEITQAKQASLRLQVPFIFASIILPTTGFSFFLSTSPKAGPRSPRQASSSSNTSPNSSGAAKRVRIRFRSSSPCSICGSNWRMSPTQQASSGGVRARQLSLKPRVRRRWWSGSSRLCISSRAAKQVSTSSAGLWMMTLTSSRLPVWPNRSRFLRQKQMSSEVNSLTGLAAKQSPSWLLASSCSRQASFQLGLPGLVRCRPSSCTWPGTAPPEEKVNCLRAGPARDRSININYAANKYPAQRLAIIISPCWLDRLLCAAEDPQLIAESLKQALGSRVY